MKFKYWLEMAWVANKSRQEYESLKRQVALDPSIMGERTSLLGGGKGIVNYPHHKDGGFLLNQLLSNTKSYVKAVGSNVFLGHSDRA